MSKLLGCLLCLSTFFVSPSLLLAQQKLVLPYDSSLVDYDSEAQTSGFTTVTLPVVSGVRRGVMGADSIVYWVADDMRYLIAYEKDKAIWKTDVIKPSLPIAGRPEITALTLSNKTTIDVYVGESCVTHVNRINGRIISVFRFKQKKH